MNFPEYLTIELSPQDKADLAATRNTFMASMTGLTEKQQLARAEVIASGMRQADPYTRALAQQVVDAAKVRDRVARAEAELKNIDAELRAGGYRPKDPHWRGAALERREELSREIENDYARAVGIQQDPLETAQRKAALNFRERRTEALREQALAEAISRKTAELEAEVIEQQAEAIARTRLATGRSSANSASDSQ